MKMYWGVVLALLVGNMAVWCSADPSWGYTDTSSWPTYCSTETKQSPIDFKVEDTSLQASTLKVKIADTVPATITNQDWTIKVKPNNPSQVSLQAVPLEDEQTSWYLYDLEFRFGNTNDVGSGHKLNGVEYPLELDFIFYSDQYSSYDYAQNASRGLAIVAVLGTFSTTGSSALDAIISNINATDFYETSSSVSLSSWNVTDLLPSDFNSKFFFYEGSKPYPNCHQPFVWMIANSTLNVSQSQLNFLRTLTTTAGGNSLAPNYRSAQALNGRTVYASWNKNELESSPTGGALYLALFFIIAPLLLALFVVAKTCSKKTDYQFVDETR